MATHILKYFLVMVSALLFHLGSAQSINDSSHIYGTYGKAYDFSFGSATMPFPDRISIRADKISGRIIEFRIQIKRYDINLSFLNSRLNITTFEKAYFNIDSVGNVQSNSDIRFDLDLQNSNKVQRFVISYGNSEITAKSKILTLIFDPFLGRPRNLNEFSHIKILVLEEMFTDYFQISNNTPLSTYVSKNYPGDPFLLDEISQMQRLESFIFHDGSDHEINQYLIDSPTKKLFELPYLKSICLSGIPYLPIPGNEWKKIEYFQTRNIFYPELVNLALVLNHFEKDISDFNWKNFLDLGDVSASLIIPENGKYQTFYKNGALLCEGNYLNGKEDGEWKFWYEDGRICEYRIYKEGKREGEWNFLRPTDPYYPEIDTILKLTYRNDTLVYRQDRYIEREEVGSNGCYYFDANFGETVLFKEEYWIEYKQNGEVLINKTLRLYDLETNAPYRQFPAGKDEVWEYAKDGWTYKIDDYCNNKMKMRSVILRGNPGATAHYSLLTEISVGHSGEIYKTESSVDLQNCFWQTSQFSAENENSEFKQVKTESGTILLNNLPCKNP